MQSGGFVFGRIVDFFTLFFFLYMFDIFLYFIRAQLLPEGREHTMEIKSIANLEATKRFGLLDNKKCLPDHLSNRDMVNDFSWAVLYG